MKKLVGQREKANAEGRAVGAFVEILATGGFKPAVVEYDGSCNQCKTPVKMILREDIETGEIWLEGPDECTCGNQLSDPNAEFKPLSQEAIEGLFGHVLA